MAERILVFPAGTPEARNFAEANADSGKTLIGASSLAEDSEKLQYQHWIRLPYIHESDFDYYLKSAIAEHRITGIFSSHEVVRNHLAAVLPVLAPQVQLLSRPMSRRQESLPYDSFLALAEGLDTKAAALPLPTELAAVLTRSLAMRGESGLGKLACLLALGHALPAGDMVEIGALSGRSAFVLGWLARRYRIGSVLILDPWAQAEAMQHDGPEVLLAATRALDFGVFFNEFLENLIPCFYGAFNYVRDAACAVRPQYVEGYTVGPNEFGTAVYSGQIALLHIDGNHDFAAVSRDTADWVPLVKRGGWVVVDDYVWAFGTGPRRAGDALLEAGGFDRSFVCEGALFLRRA